MTDLSIQQIPAESGITKRTVNKIIMSILLIVALVIAFTLANRIQSLTLEDALLSDSTIAELALWIAEQSEEEESPSLLVQIAKAQAGGIVDADALTASMQNALVIWIWGAMILMVLGLIGIVINARWLRLPLLIALMAMVALLFVIPNLRGDDTIILLMISIMMLVITIFLTPGKVGKVMGFLVILSVLLVTWETVKLASASASYKIVLPAGGWEYDTYPDIESALTALQNGDIRAVMFDERDLDDFMPAYPTEEDENPEDFPYSDLRYINRLNRSESFAFLPFQPELAGRVTIAVREEDSESFQSISQVMGESLATVGGSFAEEEYLAIPRELVLVNLRIFNDLNMPHLQTIMEAFLQPARRNGELLLVRILGDAGLYTLGEALFGFIFGALFGFLLGSFFAHSSLMERGLLPFVVASQTVPILAFAPLVVIWLGASAISVSVIAAYLTFFPVTINTLRGLQSPNPTQIELMRSYAANKFTIYRKLRLPAALPYIFTALKVSATASVVGAIIGELPSGIQDGLGRAILDFSSDYSLISTPKLWSAIIMAALVGIGFFIVVSIIERMVLRGYIRES